MNRYYHPSLNRWGPNLSLVFSGTRKMATIEPDEWDVIKKAVRNCKIGKGGMIDTSEWGTVSFISSLDRVIEFLANCVDPTGKCVFADFVLPLYDKTKSIKGFSEEGLIDWEKSFINYKAQRTINMLNLVQHLFNFKSELVFGATGRQETKTGKTYINDGQHGTLLLGIVGAEKVPVRWVPSDDEYVDFDQFLALNVDNYETEDYDKHRNQVQRANKMKEAKQELYVSDKLDFYLDKLIKKHNVKFIPKSKTNMSAGETPHVTKYQALLDEFKQDVLDRAIKIVRMAWPAHGVPQEPVWGLCELVRAQNKKTAKEWEDWEYAFSVTLKTKWPTGPDGVWKEVNAVMQKLMPKTDSQYRDDFRIQTGNRGKMIGTAFSEVYTKWDEARQQAPGNPRSYGITVDPIYRLAGGDKFTYPLPGFPIGNMIGYKKESV
jgi:hypothetical protein